jgi:hypothetical protein
MMAMVLQDLTGNLESHGQATLWLVQPQIFNPPIAVR